MGLFGRGPEAGHGEAVLKVGAEVVHPADWEHDVETELVNVNVNGLARALGEAEWGAEGRGEGREETLRVVWKSKEEKGGGRKEGRRLFTLKISRLGPPIFFLERCDGVCSSQTRRGEDSLSRFEDNTIGALWVDMAEGR